MGSLRPGQQPSDRYDVVCRVFRLKFGEMLQDLRAGALGKPVAFMYTVEWQKRGLPHVHLLLWLAAADKMRSVSDYDEIRMLFDIKQQFLGCTICCLAF